MPYGYKLAGEVVAINPQSMFYNVECLLGDYFKDVYYVKIFIEMAVPYFIILMLFLEYLATRKPKEVIFSGFL